MKNKAGVAKNLMFIRGKYLIRIYITSDTTLLAAP